MTNTALHIKAVLHSVTGWTHCSRWWRVSQRTYPAHNYTFLWKLSYFNPRFGLFHLFSNALHDFLHPWPFL